MNFLLLGHVYKFVTCKTKNIKNKDLMDANLKFQNFGSTSNLMIVY